MNDFSELENELKKLRPAQPSPVLFERIEEAMGKHCRASAAADATHWRRPPRRTPYNWLSLGLGLAAAAVLVLLATINMERRQERGVHVDDGPRKAFEERGSEQEQHGDDRGAD